MKLQPASRKEVIRIAKGVLVCDVLMAAALFLLSLVGVGTFTPLRIALGALLGSVVAVANFAILCLTVQNAAQTEDKKLMRQKFQLSYNIRLVLQAAWVIVCFLVPQIHFVAGAAPILYPNVVIYFLQSRGKLVQPSDRTAAPVTEAEEEDHLESFEV